MGERTTTPSGLSASEELLARTFEHWREEFRSILENHRREIQDRLEKIEREIEKKSDKENVEVLVRSIYSDLHRHAEEIDRLHARSAPRWGPRPCGRSSACVDHRAPSADSSAF